MAEGTLVFFDANRSPIALCLGAHVDAKRSLVGRFNSKRIVIGHGCSQGSDLGVAADYRNEMCLYHRIGFGFTDEPVQRHFEARCRLLERLGVDQVAKTKVGVLHGSSVSFSCVKIRVRPSACTRVSSCEKRSRSCLTRAPLGSSSSQ